MADADCRKRFIQLTTGHFNPEIDCLLDSVITTICVIRHLQYTTKFTFISTEKPSASAAFFNRVVASFTNPCPINIAASVLPSSVGGGMRRMWIATLIVLPRTSSASANSVRPQVGHDTASEQTDDQEND